MARSDRRRGPVPARALALLAGLATAAGTIALPALAGPSPQRTVRVRVAAMGQPNGPSANPVISGDGRYIAFETRATNLGQPDPDGSVRDVYRYDDKSAAIKLLSAPTVAAGATGPSSDAAISQDGSVVAFYSLATNLVPRATNVVPGAAPHGDVYAWSADAGLQQVSVSSTQVPADGDSSEPDVSADGRRIVFSSTAGNLSPGAHPPGQRDVYVRDLSTARTVLVSADPAGDVGDGSSSAPAISPDGRYVSFATTATNLVARQTTSGSNVVVRDLTAGTTALASVSGSGTPQAGGPQPASPPVSDISSGGRYVAFASGAIKLVKGDTNRRVDVFVRDMTGKRTVRASLATTDQQADGASSGPSISADGRFVTFLSRAPNLTPQQPSGENVFVRDLVRHTTVMADVASNGRPRGAESAPISQRASSADDGSTTVFVSSAKRVVADKTSSVPDVFLRRLLPAPISIAGTTAGLDRGHVVITFASADRAAGGLLCRLDHHARAICPLGAVVLPLLGKGKHVLTAYAGGLGAAYAARPTVVRITVKPGGHAVVKVSNPGSQLGAG
jgi:Tol biopolymer transport system component